MHNSSPKYAHSYNSKPASASEACEDDRRGNCFNRWNNDVKGDLIIIRSS